MHIRVTSICVLGQDGVKLCDVYEEVVTHLKQKKADLVDKLTKAVG